MGFVQVSTEYVPPERLVIAAWGREKVGKTSFAMTMPGPIYLYNFDYGYRPVTARAEGKKLYVANYEFPDQFSVSSYKAIMSQFQKDWIDGMEQAAEVGGSLVVDTASQLWQLIGQCLTGEIREERAEENVMKVAEGKRAAQDTQLDWRKANATMDQILKRPLTVAGREKVNVCYIQRAQPVYDGSKDTGDVKMQGFGTAGNIVEVKLFIDKTEPKNPNDKPMYRARIDFSRYLGDTIGGSVILAPTWDKLMGLVS